MILSSDFKPRIEPIFGQHMKSIYTEIIHDAFYKILVEQMRLKDCFCSEITPAFREQFLSMLPIVTKTECHEVPGTLSLFILAKERANVFKFFFDLASGWLLPGRRLNVAMIYSVDIRLPDIGNDVYTFCEMMIRIESQRELDQIMSNLPAIETELQMGLASSHHARRILEVKGFSNDEKTAVIQEHMAYLIDHRPQDFDQDALTEMQHVLLISREDFKQLRGCRHLSRIIAIHYLFRKSLREAVKKLFEKRYLHLKIFNALIKQGDQSKIVLGVLIGVNFFRDKESLDKIHIIKAIQHFIPNAIPIENSFFSNRRGSELICTLYVEIEKSDGKEFSSEEIKLLRRELSQELKSRVKHLLHPVFMPRNEEEIIRNTLSLSSQISYLRDIPQVFISFDEQTHSNVFFTVILVRVVRSDNKSVQEMFIDRSTCLEYIPDRVQIVGTLRKKHQKEATIFRVKMVKEQFLRSDHSIDINRARQTVVAELFNIMGDIRDFNGGMISKQNEMLEDLKALLKEDVRYSELLLENFFYSLNPVIMRNVLDPETLKTLFQMLLSKIEERLTGDEMYASSFSTDPFFVFAMIKTDDKGLKDEITGSLNKLQLHSSQLATTSLLIYDTTYLGYIYRSDDTHRQQHFIHILTQALSTQSNFAF